MRPAMIVVSLLLGLTQMSVPTHARADNARPVVVELFTSQGCSSCPPADALLGELARNPNILPLAFHVTYWNNLGWCDPFSLDSATARQRAYQRSLRTEAIYTPQMIVDGQTDVIGSDRALVSAAIARARPSESVPITIRRTAEGLSVQVAAGRVSAANGEARLLLIGFDGAHRTTVPRGENAGRDLSETNIVRDITVLGGWTGLALNLSPPAPQGERAALLIQAADGRILGAAVLARP